MRGRESVIDSVSARFRCLKGRSIHFFCGAIFLVLVFVNDRFTLLILSCLSDNFYIGLKLQLFRAFKFSVAKSSIKLVLGFRSDVWIVALGFSVKQRFFSRTSLIRKLGFLYLTFFSCDNRLSSAELYVVISGASNGCLLF